MSSWHSIFIFFIFLFCQPVSADLVEKTTSQIGESPDITMSLLKVTGGLLLVIIAIFGSALAYRRFGNMTPMFNEDLRVIGGVSLSAKERVVLMQVGEDQILLGVSPSSIQCLHVLTKNIDMSQDASSNIKSGNTKSGNTKSFATQLNSAINQWKSK